MRRIEILAKRCFSMIPFNPYEVMEGASPFVVG